MRTSQLYKKLKIHYKQCCLCTNEVVANTDICENCFQNYRIRYKKDIYE